MSLSYPARVITEPEPVPLPAETRPTTLPAFAAVAEIRPGVTPCFSATSLVEKPKAKSLAICFMRRDSVANQAADIQFRGDLIRYRGPLVFDQQVHPIAVPLLDLDSVADLSVPLRAVPCRSCGCRRADPV